MVGPQKLERLRGRSRRGDQAHADTVQQQGDRLAEQGTRLQTDGGRPWIEVKKLPGGKPGVSVPPRRASVATAQRTPPCPDSSTGRIAQPPPGARGVSSPGRGAGSGARSQERGCRVAARGPAPVPPPSSRAGSRRPKRRGARPPSRRRRAAGPRLRRCFVERQPQHRRRLQLRSGGLSSVGVASGQELLRERLQRRELLRRVVDDRGGAEHDHRAVVDRVLEHRTCEHEPVEQRRWRTSGRRRERAQYPARGRAVHVEAITEPRVECRDH